MRLLLVEERNAVTESALERTDVENEEQDLAGIVVVVVRESEACEAMGFGTHPALVGRLGVRAVCETGREVGTPATRGGLDDD